MTTTFAEESLQQLTPSELWSVERTLLPPKIEHQPPTPNQSIRILCRNLAVIVCRVCRNPRTLIFTPLRSKRKLLQGRAQRLCTICSLNDSENLPKSPLLSSFLSHFDEVNFVFNCEESAPFFLSKHDHIKRGDLLILKSYNI